MVSYISSSIKIFDNTAFDYLSLAQSPAEVDMLRFLSFYCLNQESIFYDTDFPRLRDMTSWDFYNAIYDSETTPLDILLKINTIFTNLKFENELSLNSTEHYLSPYHPMLNNLPPLMIQNYTIDWQNLNCHKITEAQPYLDMNYRYFTTETHLKHQIHALNQTKDRNTRLTQMVYAKRIKNHAFFKNLNGQRGVFAKRDIQAGTIIDYYSGEYMQYPAPMPPILCTWRVNKTSSKISYLWHSRKIAKFSGWTDAFILGNMMKLVNSCYSDHKMIADIGNIGCYFFHFQSKGFYISLPVYVATKDIPKDTELLSFYHVGTYQNNRIYGVK